MKTKRALFSIIVSLSVFWLSMILDYDTFNYEDIGTHKKETSHIQGDNSILNKSDKENLEVYSYQYGIVASNNEKLYLHRMSDTDSLANQDLDGSQGSNKHVLNKELDIPDTPASYDDTESTDEEEPYSDHDQSEINISKLNESELGQSEPDKQDLEEATSLYANIGISIANSFVNIRDRASTESDIVGKLHKDSAAKVLDTVGDWYYIESGSVKGYISSKYLKTGIPDDELVNNYGSLKVNVDANGLNVREKPDMESSKLTVIYQNERYPAIEILDEWVKIDISDDNVIGYVNKEYVQILVDFEKAISKKEEEELIRLQKEEEERLRKIEAEERAKKETEIKQRDEVDYTDKELKLLACLVHSEAGDQSYEGKLAVANIVLNRMKSKKYPNTMNDVIYQPGQFSVAKNGSLAKQLANYENYSSKSHKLTIKAAKAALSGENNIGNRLYFHAYKAAVKKGYDQKKNSVKLEDHLFW